MHEGLKPCQFRQVDNHGRILCGLIKGGDREVSVNLCRACPVPQINCQHLRATLEKNTPTPLTVRYATGRVEVWDNDPPTIDFKHAACAEKTMPIHSPRDCVGCPLRLPNVVPQNAIQVAHHSRQNPAPNLVAAADERQPAAPRTKSAPRQRPAVAAAQAVVPTESQPRAAPPPAPPHGASQVGVTAASNSAADLIARAQSLARKKAEERAAAERAAREEQEQYAPAQASAAPQGGSSKIILLQQWLADQVNKKQARVQAPAEPDAEGVSEIRYASVAPAYNEDSGYERCVGWTD